MVILFKGTDVSKNYAPQALSLCAGLSATKYLKKTLVLQLTTKYPIERYVIGKRISDQSIDDKKDLFEDTGMDSLTRRAGVKTFTATHFANAVVPAVSSESLFDILKVSKKVEADVATEIIKEPESVGTIINSAKKIYDNIFVLCDGKRGDVINAVLPYMDKSVTCISQGKKEEITAPSCDDNYFLVTNYDYKSQYSSHHMQKLYGVKKLFVMPYNVDFKDYYTNENMIQYILSNTEPEKSDYSYHLISEMAKLTKTLIGGEDTEEDPYRFTKKTVARYAKEKVLLDGDNVKIEVTEKEFLKPSKTLVHVSATEKFKEDEGSSEKEITELDPKKLKKIKAEKRKEKVKTKLSAIKSAVISKTSALMKKEKSEDSKESSQDLERKEA